MIIYTFQFFFAVACSELEFLTGQNQGITVHMSS
jgi:hypothetical protein